MTTIETSTGHAILSRQGTWPADWLRPDMGASVGALMTARSQGSNWSQSSGPYAGFNLGLHVGDDPQVVGAHRRAIEAAIGMPALWLNQVHGAEVVQATADLAQSAQVVQADGSFATESGVICTVMVADCLPVLLAAPGGRGVAALHAGWRGLAGAGAMAGRGILESGVQRLCEATACAPSELIAWLGPCIGPNEFEVGQDVLDGFGEQANRPGALFAPKPVPAGDAPRWAGPFAWAGAQTPAGLGRLPNQRRHLVHRH